MIWGSRLEPAGNISSRNSEEVFTGAALKGMGVMPHAWGGRMAWQRQGSARAGQQVSSRDCQQVVLAAKKARRSVP